MRETASTDDRPAGVKPYKSLAFDQYLTFCAIGGMLVSDTGAISGVTLGEFCELVGVDTATTWRWKHQTPNWGALVRARREEIIPWARETAAWNRLFFIGMSSVGPSRQHNDQKSAVDALKTYVGHYGELRLPVQRQDIKVQGGLMDVLEAAERDGIIEGETVEPTDTDTAAGTQAAAALPQAP